MKAQKLEPKSEGLKNNELVQPRDRIAETFAFTPNRPSVENFEPRPSTERARVGYETLSILPITKFHLLPWIAFHSPSRGDQSHTSDVSSIPKNGQDFDPSYDRGRNFEVDTVKFAKIISDVELFLRKPKSRRRRAYMNCPTGTLQDVEARLSKLQQTSNNENYGENERARPDTVSATDERFISPIEPHGDRANHRDPARGPNVDSGPTEKLDVPSFARINDSTSNPVSYEVVKREFDSFHEKFENRESSPPPIDRKRWKIQLLKLTKEVFQFFLLLDCGDLVIARKYWGALLYLTDVRHPKKLQPITLTFLGQDLTQFTDNYANRRQHRRFFGRLSKKLEDIRRQLDNGRGPLPWELTLPTEFVRVWVRILVHLTVVATDPKIEAWTTSDRLGMCENLLDKGRKKLYTSIAQQPISETEAVIPVGIVSLIIAKLIKDVTSGQQDIAVTYFEYSKKLVS